MPLDPEGGFEQLMVMARGFQMARMSTVAVDLAVFDFLEQPRSAVEAAAWLKADARAVGIFLNGLAALGLLVKEVDYFHNSKIVSRFLVQGRDDYRGAIIQHMGHTMGAGLERPPDHGPGGLRPRGVEPETWVDAHPEEPAGGKCGTLSGGCTPTPGKWPRTWWPCWT